LPEILLVLQNPHNLAFLCKLCFYKFLSSPQKEARVHVTPAGGLAPFYVSILLIFYHKY